MKRTMIVVLAGLLISSLSAGVSAGKMRFYFDTNHNGAYDAGEQVSGADAYYTKSKTNTMTHATTAADGCVTESNMKKDDKVFARFLAYSEPCTRGDRGFAGGMFDLYVDSDTINGDGNISRKKLSGAEADSINGGGTVNIMMNHPVFSWNLVIALNWNSDNAYRNNLKTGLKRASKYLFDITDGQGKLGKIDIRNNVGGTATWTTNADVRLYSGNQWPTTDSCWAITSGGRIHMPKYFNGSNAGAGEVAEKEWYRTFIHEFGHYALGFDEEYRSGGGTQQDWDWYRFWNHGECTWNYGVMDHQNDISEMSSNNDYRSAGFYAGKNANQCAWQIWTYKLGAGGGHYPCWQYFYDKYDNRNATQGNWHGYNGWRIAISMPSNGTYQGVNWLQQEQRSSSDRDGPSEIPTSFSNFVVWDESTFAGSAAAPQAQTASSVELAVTGPDGQPARQARVWIARADGTRLEQGITDRLGRMNCDASSGDVIYASLSGKIAGTAVSGATAEITFQAQGGPAPNGVGPKLVLSAGVFVNNGINTLRIRLTADQPLAGPPTVTVRPDFGTSLSVTMAPAGPTTYEGTVVVGTAGEGSVDVVATAGSVQTSTSSTWRIGLLRHDVRGSVFSQDGWFDTSLPPGFLTQDKAFVTIGSGSAPIMPTDPSQQMLADPQSLQLQDGFTVGANLAGDWRFDPNTLVGRDATTFTLRRFDEASRTWITVPSTIMAGRRVLSASGLVPGIYAAFAAQSADTTAPGQITDLVAQTGEEERSVRLTWTAPGDDGATGTATRYDVWFNTEPITPSNLAQCTEAQFIDPPLAAGQPEDHSIVLPDPGKAYYFAIRARDEAENVGPLSNVVQATSRLLDTDSDGMPDQWETAYGLNPTDPSDAALDLDNDGLTNLQEYQLGTLPDDPDTDADGFSDGLEHAASTDPLNPADPVKATVPAAKLWIEGTKLGCNWLVSTASFDGYSYVEQPDRIAGIELDGVAVTPDRQIEVIGTTNTLWGEKCLTDCFWRARDPESVEPLCARVASIGGATFGSPPQGQKGVDGGRGANNIGLLMRVAGKVDYVAPNAPARFTMNDGGSERVYCMVPSGVDLPAVGDFCVVTGVSTLGNLPGGAVWRCLLIRQPSDLRKM